MKSLFLGVDGGATKCVVRLEDENGRLLSTGRGGSANIRLSVEAAWASIHQALNEALLPLQLTLAEAVPAIRAGMGLAGCEVQEALQAFLKKAPPFYQLKVGSDAYTACLGAHAGQDGAIMIAGTGVVGYHIQSGQTAKISGWGFPHDDQGGGAWLGLEAFKLALQSQDGRRPVSLLSQAVAAYFDYNAITMMDWANQANATDFATLAPLVVKAAEAGDETAVSLMQEAAACLDRVSDALIAKQLPETVALPCVLIGSIAPYLRPFLKASTQARLIEGKDSPEAGAILWVRQYAA